MLREALKEANKKNKLPKAIIPVHLYGMPAKIVEIVKIANEYDIPVIEDSAESLGSCISNKQCGSFGKFGVLSFNGNKIITTSGGGALISSDQYLIQKARFLSTQARDPAPHYQHSQVGYNYRLSNILAGIGRGQLEVLNDRIKVRRENFQLYHKYFTELNNKGFEIKFQDEPKNYFSNRWLTCIIIDPSYNAGISREDIRREMELENIETRPLWKPMHQQPIFENSQKYINDISDTLFAHGLCFPSGSNLLQNDFERIFNCLDKIFNKF